MNEKVKVAVIAGPHLPEDSPEFVTRHARAAKVLISNEFEAGLAAGLGKAAGWGVLVMAGTGSFCKGRNKSGQEQYSGGWGPLIGDEGSGYDIGREALIAVARASDGRVRPTALAEALLSELRIEGLSELRRLLYRPPLKRSKIAALARPVSEAAANGDETAKEILGRAGVKLASLCAPVVRSLFPDGARFPVILSGGILRGEPLVAATAAAEIRKIHAGAEISVSALEPLAGTIIIGLEAAGIPVGPEIISNLSKTVRHCP
jgi:N-acetylglucosamine kinase-like BadF-type ATPase